MPESSAPTETSAPVRAFERFFLRSEFAADPLRRAVSAASRLPEPVAVAGVLAAARVPAEAARRIRTRAQELIRGLRDRRQMPGRSGLMQTLLQEYALSSQEGIALMCLAEALLRIPDNATRDALIRDKIAKGRWQGHLGRSPSLFVNAATWGLLITGRLVATHSESGLSAAIGRVLATGGEPLIRASVDLAMRMLGEQFVAGESIEEALRNSGQRERQGFRYSYDMLGEAALTATDAARYLAEYERAIHAIGRHGGGRGIIDGPGISIKLSALHPRYGRAQSGRVLDELLPILVRLGALAKQYDIGLNIDAEEAERLEISLDLLEKLAFEPRLQAWNGLGFVVQAYQKRCPAVVEYLIDLARRSRRRLMIRLVKGAYWDSEIKRAQVDGQAGYCVYTRKPYTDVTYIACARRLLAAADAVYPQFATHNAQTLASVHELADPAGYAPGQFEFQCLHGMGEALYEQVVGASAERAARPCRIYAPVGTHRTLLAYLVRRLLENGANTSFVNRVADESVPLDELVRDPVEIVEDHARLEGAIGLPHPRIPLPRDLYGDARRNSTAPDLNSETELAALAGILRESIGEPAAALPMLADGADPDPGQTALASPADPRDIVGYARDSSPAEIERALRAAQRDAPAWAALAPAARAHILEQSADTLEARMPRLMSLLVREAGRSAANAVGEVREAVDFLRYYAAAVRGSFDNDTHRPLGPVLCISPWNFPLAIFLGQIAAALAAGNVVLAKPAEQTPLVAAAAVRVLWDAGVPRSALQLLPGRGAEVGGRLAADARVRGVLFTGSTDAARSLQRVLAARLDDAGGSIPLIAETGGQNAMIVDSSALPEQVVSDVLISAFDSAGQRCSALRVLCVQAEAAGRLLEMLLGAMAELRVGSPDRLDVDVGPVIDAEARDRLLGHIDAMRARGCRIHQADGQHAAMPGLGTFVPPTVIEIDSLADLAGEVFGPVLHFLRFQREELDGLLSQINATGYGLTLGLHTRIDESIARVIDAARVGNVYVNRSMIGAVVGVQPFGGEGLSGTGPKSGGPLYLYRLLSRCPQDVLIRSVMSPGAAAGPARGASAALLALRAWAEGRAERALADTCARLARRVPEAQSLLLRGPTGELNTYRTVARRAILCLAEDDADRLVQLAAVLAVHGRALWPAEHQGLLGNLPALVREQVMLVRDWTAAGSGLDLVLLHGPGEQLLGLQQMLSRREGAVIPIVRLAPGSTDVPLERLVLERVVSINTAAAGGNASLMTLQ